jgi:hypothetical protein
MSIHVISPKDGPALEEEVGPVKGLTRAPLEQPSPDDPLFHLIRGTRRQRTYRVLAQVLSGCRRARAVRLLEKIYACGDLETKRVAASALSSLDPGPGAARMREVAAADIGADTAVSRSTSIGLSVRRNGPHAELVAEGIGRSSVILRLDEWAEETLLFAATAAAFCVRQLPGKLTDRDRSMLARALVELGLFRVAPRGGQESPFRLEG